MASNEPQHPPQTLEMEELDIGVHDARNWSRRQKLITTWVVSLFKAISGLASSSIVPGLATIAMEFHTDPGILTVLPLSSYFIGYTIGLLVIGPLSETFGRIGMLQGSNMSFIIFNLAAGLSQSSVQLNVLRAFSGFGAAGPLSLGGGILHDCWTPEERTTMITIYALPAQLTPALGPILGALCQSYLDWRWAFFIVSIASTALQILAFLTIGETYKPVLQRRARKNQARQGSQLTARQIASEDLGDAFQRLRINMVRPFSILYHDPLAQLLALYNAVVYGILYLLISALGDTWEGEYHQQPVLASLNYLFLGTGLVAGAQICRPLNKRIYKYLKTHDPEGKGRPEYRLPMVAIGSILVPIGLLWFGWAANQHIFFIFPNIGVFLFATGVVMILNITSLYLVDIYGKNAASATGAVNVFRALAGFAFPLFASRLYQTLGQGWGNSLLALVSVGLGWPLPLVLWKFGHRLRLRQGENC